MWLQECVVALRIYKDKLMEVLKIQMLKSKQLSFYLENPALDIFYELIFLMTTFSFLFTMSAMALCRVKRTVPPSHRVYLVAKLVCLRFCLYFPFQYCFELFLVCFPDGVHYKL